MSRATDSAFPTPHFVAPNGDIQWGASGLTIREEFAKAAMQGLCANHSMVDNIDLESAAWLASKSVLAADALIQELEKAHG